MGSYILKRLFQTLVVVWAALTLIFFLVELIPGDAVEAKSGEKANANAQANQRKKYGLNDPVVVRYSKYFTNLVQGDLGFSFVDEKDVNSSLKETVKNSGRLLFWGGLVQIFGSLTLGFVSAARRNSILDRVTTFLSVAVQALPVVVTGLLATFYFGAVPQQHKWGWLNFNREHWPIDGWRLGVIPPANAMKSIVLPAIVVGLVNMAFLARLLRSSMLETLRADFLRTARAKGLSNRRVLVKHAARNALIPWLTAAGLSLAEIFGIAVQTEAVFGIDGLGSRIANAAGLQDGPVVLGLSTVVVLAIAFTNLVIDLSYSFLDPRIRVGGEPK
jgi:ABC-type dipeptide/oligopeptide/nickel transport system permease component